ncbi:hypothetical protein ACFXB3_07275 [Streptomyces sp. NPDC059447]|uniref:hypothetical protein n=1 Tax=Streptomyces sp. NPDC059447 TaxID=3346834 RepID=UPI0036846666
MPKFTLIKTPSDVDIAWAERAERQRIAFEVRDLETAWAYRQEAVAYDRANPGSSSLVVELVALNFGTAA